MKLVMYSGGQSRKNHQLHEAIFELCGYRKKGIRFTYIPFCSEYSNIYFNRAVQRYSRFGVSEFHCLPVDKAVSHRDFTKALSSDVIYLAGGNTFYFLNSLRKAGLIAPLRRFARSGGVLAGLSAGALILTPNIRLAEIPRYDRDENEVGLKNLKGLGLTSFEFSPHYSPTAVRDRSLLTYSRKTPYPIFASADGGGIVVNGDQFTTLGNTVLFHRGQRSRLTF